jgi:DNA-nicking Smr family endonuclease
MLSCDLKENEVIKVDLHRMKVWEAAQYLNMIVTIAPKEVKEIIVIHGYRSGKELMNMVRNDFTNKRVQRKYLSLNHGVTSLILN